MATHTVSASSLKYASSSSWTSGSAKQGVLSSTRYEGAIRFSDLANFDMSNINITNISMKVTIAAVGGAYTKNLTLYRATKDAISGSISSMRGSSIGAISLSGAYNTTKTISFNSSTNASMFNTLKSYFAAGNQTLIMYVPTTRGQSDDKNYCYDYMSVTAMSLTFTFEYMQSNSALSSNTVIAGSSATINITPHNSSQSHKATWSFGTHSYTQTIAAGQTTVSYAIPLSWLDAIPSAASGTATVTLETFDAAGVSLGTTSTPFTVTVPSSALPTFTGISITPVNSNSVINGWNVFAYNKSQAKIAINGAQGIYGSTIASYSITTNPSVGNSTAVSFTTGVLSVTGTITVTAKVTDSRGMTASRESTFYVYPYGDPSFTSITAYRCNSTGAQDDVGGTYVYVNAAFGCYGLNENNRVTATAVLTQVNGSYSTSATLTSGTRAILGGGNLSTDSAYKLTITLTDSVGSQDSAIRDISTAQYIIHIKKGGKAMGIGRAADQDGTLAIGWDLLLSGVWANTLPTSGIEGQICVVPAGQGKCTLYYYKNGEWLST